MPADAGFPIYRVAQWDGKVSQGMISESRQHLFDKRTRQPIGLPTPTVLTSCILIHQRVPENSESIEVDSSRPERENEICWDSLVYNMVADATRDELRTDGALRGSRRIVPGDACLDRTNAIVRAIEEGRTPPTAVTIRVDETPVAFQVVSLGRSWGAVAMLGEVTIHILGRNVPFNGLSLVCDSDSQDV